MNKKLDRLIGQKSSRESGQRLGTNNIPTRSIRIVRMAVTKTRHITFEMKPYGWMRHMGVSRPTEMTIRDLLQEELRKRGVTVVPEFSVSTPVGRLAPDMLLKNGAQYVVETKLGAETKHSKIHRVAGKN